MADLIDVFRNRWKFGLVTVVAFLDLTYRFLFSTLWGALFVTLLTYVLLPIFHVVEPMSLSELLLWFDNLSDDVKGAAITSLLTVVGFLIAFQSAHAAWRAELAGTLQTEAATSINDHLTELCGLLTKVAIYHRGVAGAIALIRSGAVTAYNPARFWNSQNAIAHATAARVSELLATGHMLASRFSPFVTNGRSCAGQLEQAFASVGDISESVWWIVPPLDDRANSFLADFSRFARDADELRAMADRIEAVVHGVSARAGFVRSTLMSVVARPSVYALLWMLKHRKDIASIPTADSAP